MKTKGIIEQIKADHMTYIEATFPDLKLVHTENTNPRRDYLGRLTVWHNPDDGKFISLETYGNDMGWALWRVFEVTPKEVPTIIYEPIQP